MEPAPGSRAITIPLHSQKSINRRRRLRDLSKADALSSFSAGPSSLSSDQDSSWSPSHTRETIPQLRKMKPVVSIPPTHPSTASVGDKGKQKATDQPSLPSPLSAPSTTATNAPTTPTSTTFPLASPSSSAFPSHSPLSPTMLLSSSYKSVSLNSHSRSPDEPARIITYTKHSQGFTWNDELFLPSYLLGRRRRERERERAMLRQRNRQGDRGEDSFSESESEDEGWSRGHDRGGDWGFEGEGDDVGVVEVFVTDEEVKAMMP